MDIHEENGATGRLAIQLGPVERWVVATCALALLSMVGYMAKSFANRLDDQGKQLSTMATSQAVMTAQLSTLSIQLADVPALTRAVAEDRVRIEQNAADIKQLQQDRRQ